MKTSPQRTGWWLALLGLALTALGGHAALLVITAIPDQTIAVNTSTPNLPFTIDDAETPASALVLTASHDNAALVTNIVLGGTSASRTVRVVPHFDAVGTALITITVIDGDNGASAETFLLTVVGAPPQCVFAYCPTNMEVDCQSPTGTVVNFTARGTNICNPSDLTFSCDWNSGDRFPLGTTPVNCWAMSSSQTQHCSFTVTVLTNCPAGQMRFGGLSYTALGGATAQVVSNELILSNLGTQGTGGISMTGLEGFHSGTITLGGTDSNSLPEGASITMSAYGFVNGSTDTLISSLRATRAGGLVEYIADYSSIGAVGCTVMLFDGANLVAQAQDVTGVVARVTGSTFGDRWTPAFTDPGSARPFSEIEFSSRPMVALSGGLPVFGTRLVLSPQAHRVTDPFVDPSVTPTYSVGWLPWFNWYQFPYVVAPWRNPGDPPPNQVFLGSLSRFDVVAQGAGPLRIVDAQAGMFGFRHKAFGGAQLSGAGTSFRIQPGEGVSNQVFGVDIIAGGSDIWDSRAGNVEVNVGWLRLTPQPEPPGTFHPIGASLKAALHGFVDGNGPDILGAIEAMKTGSNTITISGSFPTLGAFGQKMEIFRGSTLVYSGSGTNSASVGYWPEDFGGVLPPPCFGPGCPGPDPEIAFRWSDSIGFAVGGTNVIGDRIRFVASDPDPMPSLKLDFLGLRFGGGLPGLQFIAERAMPSGLSFGGLAHRAIGTTSLTTTSNELAVAKAGTNEEFGVSLALGNAPFADVSIRGLDSASPDFSQVRVESHGSMNGLPEQLLGAVIARKVGTNLEFTTDFSSAVPLSAPDVTIIVYDGETIVSVSPGNTNIIVRIPIAIYESWEMRPLHQPRPGPYRARLRFPDRRIIELSGGQAPVIGTRVEFQACWTCGNPSPQPSLRSAPTLSRVDVVARGLPTVYVSREKLALLAQAAESYRLSRLLAERRELHVHNLKGGLADPGGVTFPLNTNRASNFGAHWRPVDPRNLTSTGAMLSASAHGVLTGGTNELLGATTIAKLALLKEIFANFAPVMPPSRRVEVLRSNAVVFTTSLQGASGLVASVNDWPLGCGKTTVDPAGPLGLWWRFWPEAEFLINNQFVSGDEIRILAENTPVALDHLTQFSLQTEGISELQLTSAVAEEPGPIMTKVQRFGDTLVISWDTTNPRQTLQSADHVTGLWTDVPGVTVSPFVTLAAGARKFYRVRQQ